MLFCIFISVLLRTSDGFILKGSSVPLVVPLGGSVVLPCSVDSPLPLNDLEVGWKRSDSQNLIHLYQNEDIRPEVQDQNYHGRVHFFTENIKDGNFSLLINNLTAKDEGEYTCTVHSGHESQETHIEIKHVERLIVSGSDQSISSYVGADVTLNCFVDSHIKPEEIEEVSWKKTDKDEPILVLLYQNNETFPDLSDNRYRDRVEFFIGEIHRGNFSLRLKEIRTEDKGLYICQAFAGELSANTTVTLVQLGLSGLHIMVLILCITACEYAVFISYLIYRTSNNTDTRRKVWNLHVSLVFFPNICVFCAFIIWGVVEGFRNESVSCCALYILRPVMLLWVVKYLKYLQDHKAWIMLSRIQREFSVFTIIIYSVFFELGWKGSAFNKDIYVYSRAVLGFIFGLLVLCCLFILIITEGFNGIMFGVVLLSLLQMVQITFSFGLENLAFLFLILVQFLLCIGVLLLQKCILKWKVLKKRWMKLGMTLLDVLVVTYYHLVILDRQKDFEGWICVILFIQVLKMITLFECSVHEARQEPTEAVLDDASLQGSKQWHLCNVIMYMFGAVGVVLLNSGVLMTELILKARNGERVIKDLRYIVFPSECIFALYWVVLQIHTLWKINKIESELNQNNLQR